MYLGVNVRLLLLLLLSSLAYLLLLGLLLRAVNTLEGLGDPLLLILFVRVELPWAGATVGMENSSHEQFQVPWI